MQLETELLRTGRSWVPAIGQFRSYTAGRFRVSRLVMLTPAVSWR